MHLASNDKLSLSLSLSLYIYTYILAQTNKEALRPRSGLQGLQSLKLDHSPKGPCCFGLRVYLNPKPYSMYLPQPLILQMEPPSRLLLRLNSLDQKSLRLLRQRQLSNLGRKKQKPPSLNFITYGVSNSPGELNQSYSIPP